VTYAAPRGLTRRAFSIALTEGAGMNVDDFSRSGRKEAILPGVVAPDSHVEFVFHLGAPWQMRRVPAKHWIAQPSAFVYAQRNGALRFDGEGAISVLAFRVSPIVAARLLGRGLRDQWDEPVALQDLAGPSANALLEKLHRAAPANREGLMHAWIAQRLYDWDSEDWESERLLEQVMWHSTNESIEEAAKRLGWSARSLHRHFSRQMSLSPKDAQLAGRHLRACALLRERPDLDLTEIGGRVGFYDHAAFTHSFRERLGMAPREFRAEPCAFYERNA
jgi:AraC-like DNA-binding protein